MADDPDARATLTFDCRSIGVRRPGLSRTLSQLSVGVLITPPLLFAVMIVLDALGVRLHRFLHVPEDVAIDLGGCGLVATLGLALLSALVGSWARARPGTLDVDARGVSVRRGSSVWTIPARDVTAGIVLPTKSGFAVDLHLGDGRVLRASVESEREAQAVLTELGIGPDRRRVVVAMANETGVIPVGCVVFPLAAIAGILGLLAVLVFDQSFLLRRGVVIAWLLLLMAFAPLLARRAAALPEVIIGADGVLVRRGSRARLIPFTAIEHVIGFGAAVQLHLRPLHDGAAGERITLRGSDAAIGKAIVDRISAAMTVARSEANAAASALLDPGGRPIHEWREALGKLLRGTDYRRSAIGADDLIAVLDDASAPPAQRIGAAIALRDGDHPEAQARVRIAADACADEEVRAALEAAAADEIDEAPIHRVLAAGSRAAS